MRYEDVVRAAWAADPDFVTLCKNLYGDDATWEIVAKDGPCASDVSAPGNTPKKKKLPVMDNRGIEKRRGTEIPTMPRKFKRDDHGRFSDFASAATHATVAGAAGAGSLVAGTAVKGGAEGVLATVRQLRETSEGRAVLLRALGRTGARTAGLAAVSGVAAAVAGHHGKTAYDTVRNRGELERQHAREVNAATREADFGEFLGGQPHNVRVVTPHPGNGTPAQTTITRQVSKRGWEMAGEITGVNDEKRQVFGWASIVEKNGNPVVDLQGDYITIDELEKAAYDYVHKSRIGGAMHRRVDADGNVIEKADRPYHAADLIESFVVTPEKIEKMGLTSDTPVGWWVGFKVNDDDVWKSVKSGDWKGFSIHGAGRRKTIGEVSDLDITGAELR
jgi:hypothetical protein